MLDTTSIKGRIIDTTMRLAAERAWHDVSLLDISQASQVPLSELRICFDSKSAILAAFARAIDEEVLRNAAESTAGMELARDRLFDITMNRFDALTPYRQALKNIAADISLSPNPTLARAGLDTVRWMLAAAGIDSEGPAGAVRVAGLAAVYASVARVWLEDDDPGLARTMAALDRRLRRGERWIGGLDGIRSRLHELVGAIAGRGRRAAAGRWPADEFSDGDDRAVAPGGIGEPGAAAGSASPSSAPGSKPDDSGNGAGGMGGSGGNVPYSGTA